MIPVPVHTHKAGKCANLDIKKQRGRKMLNVEILGTNIWSIEQKALTMSREQSWIGTHRCLANKSKRRLSPESPSALLNRDCSKGHNEALQRGAHIEIVYKG